MALVAEGHYRARARIAEFGTSPEKSTDFVRVIFTIAEGEYKGQELAWDGFFTENSTKRTFESLQYCGCTFPNNDPTDLTGIDANEVSVTVEHQEYEKDGQTKVYARIAWVNSLTRGVSPEAKMTDQRKARFKQMMMGQVLKLKQGGGSAPATPNGGGQQLPQGGQQPPQGGQPIPF